MKFYETGRIEEIQKAYITHPKSLQSRVLIDQDTLDEYAKAMKEGAAFPPVKVILDENCTRGYFLIDGFHRFLATDDNSVTADVIGTGTMDDAIFLAAAANKTNGLHRSNEDKRRAVKMALKTDAGKTLSDREIARHCGVGDHLVAAVRTELTAGTRSGGSNNTISHTNTKQEPTVRVDKNGRKMNVSNIGKKPKDTPKKQKIKVIDEEPEEMQEPEESIVRKTKSVTPEKTRDNNNNFSEEVDEQHEMFKVLVNDITPTIQYLDKLLQDYHLKIKTDNYGSGRFWVVSFDNLYKQEIPMSSVCNF